MKYLVTVETESIFHVGYMGGKPWPSFSMEGPLLSCSTCPAAWAQIARLGSDTPVWSFKPGRTLSLVNMRGLAGAERKRWLASAQTAGLVKPGTIYRYPLDEDSYGLCYTREEALEESHDQTYKRQKGWIPSTKLNWFWSGQTTRELSPFHVLDAAVAFLAEKQPEIDGLWWDDDLDPEAYSAPRIGLFPDRIIIPRGKSQELKLKPRPKA